MRLEGLQQFFLFLSVHWCWLGAWTDLAAGGATSKTVSIKNNIALLVARLQFPFDFDTILWPSHSAKICLNSLFSVSYFFFLFFSLS